jgi:hypothetical protein
MDALDKFILEAELIHGWRATAGRVGGFTLALTSTVLACRARLSASDSESRGSRRLVFEGESSDARVKDADLMIRGRKGHQSSNTLAAPQ